MEHKYKQELKNIVQKLLFIATSSFNIKQKNIFKILKKKNLSIKLNPTHKKLSESQVLNYAKNATHIVAGTEKYSSTTINKLKKLKYIFRLGSGIENLDIQSLKLKKIKFQSSTISLEKAVGELIIGLVLSNLRKICKHDYDMKNKRWIKSMGNLLYGKYFGIIGYGKIGKYLSKLVKTFGAKTIVSDIKKFKNINQRPLSYLLSKSDIISINANFKSLMILDKKKLNRLKKNCILINTSRAELIDYDYLYKILKYKKIHSAALDVYNKEPYYGKFSKLDNVTLTPHIGSYAKEVRDLMEKEAIEKIIKNL